jgi:WD40 repeat protein
MILDTSSDKISISYDGKLLVSFTSEIELWDIAKQKRLATWDIPSFHKDKYKSCSGLVLSPNGKRIAFLGEYRKESEINVTYPVLAILDTSTGRWLYQRQFQYMSNVIFSSDSRFMFFSARDLDADSDFSIAIKKIDLENGEEHTLAVPPAPEAKLGLNEKPLIAIDRDNHLLASVSLDSRVCMWEVSRGRKLICWDTQQDSISAIAFSPDGRLLASGTAKGTLKLLYLHSIRSELKKLGLDW